MSGRSWSGHWGVANRELQQRGQSADGPVLNRLAGRDYQISESRDGEWTVRWLDAYGDSVAWFSGDIRLIFLALQYLADRTDSEFGITVDRIWRREPELASELEATATNDSILG